VINDASCSKVESTHRFETTHGWSSGGDFRRMLQ
jgi:hypothetical protein